MELRTRITNLLSACEDAGKWVGRNTEVVRNEQEGLLKELRRAGRIIRRCARSALRKMCAGVFGPSQAGKSYLISALARDDNGLLMAAFGDAVHDFILEINPEGGKESTGLVTRFTLTRPAFLPPGYPVQIRLLSETDLVKILANTYFADCEHKEEDVSDIERTLAALEKKTIAAQSPIDIDALEDLREYVNHDFRSRARVQLLEHTFWERAIAIGSNLGLMDRIQLYSLIWDDVPEFTKLLQTLLQGLESLGHATQAFCSLQALLPRSESIIDVATLKGLEVPGTAKLTVVTADGREAVLDRAVVTALTAELTIVMQEQPAPYFAHTDLLDFPGYRSRYKIEDIRRELQKEGILKELFLRGKVAYLFQRYCTERELTSMLLCIGPSNQEVQDLPGVINDWICQTHGRTPQERLNRAVSLFLVLTKFDQEFEQKKGAPSVELRWDNRLHASLLDFFGKQHEWPEKWDTAGGFKNVFLLRNPNFRFDAILNYSASGQELGVRDEMQGYVSELEAAFLKSALVQAHFTDPKLAWNSAMQLNDGGITYIRDSLSPLCNPTLKSQQICATLDECSQLLLRRLGAFYQTDDREALLKEKFVLIKTLYQRLGMLEKTHQRLGLLLQSLTITDAEILDLYPEAFRRYLEQPEESVKPIEDGHEEIDPMSFRLEDLNPFGSDEPSQERKVIRDEAAFFAEYIESSWCARLHALADDPNQQRFFQLPGPEFSALVSELAIGAARFELRETMTRAFRKAAEYVNTHKASIVNKQASIAAHCINHFVAWLGFDPHSQNDAERTVSVGASRVVVFKQRPILPKPLQLAESRQNYASLYFRDWLNALSALIIGNVNFDGEKAINIEENLLLGQILNKFKA